MRRPPPLSVLIAHDADLVIYGVRAMADRHPDRLRVVGCGQQGSTSVNGTTADVALVGTQGTTELLTERIRAVIAVGAASVVTAFTWGVTPMEGSRLLAAGATGVLSKSASTAVLIDDLERVGRGEKVLRGVVDAGRPAEVGTRCARLSTREVELLALLADGFNNAEIGERLYLAQSTVKTYLKRLYRKLGVNTRTQAVIRAVEMGLIGHGNWAMSRPVAQSNGAAEHEDGDDDGDGEPPTGAPGIGVTEEISRVGDDRIG